MARRWVLAIGAAGLALSACGTPVGVKRANPRDVHRSLTSNVLSSGRLSAPTQNILFRRDLIERFDGDPAGALAYLREELIAGRGNREDVFALAELSFYHAEDSGDRSYFRASMVYAYAFLFPEGAHRKPQPLDPRYRLAADIYNRSISEGFAATKGGEVQLEAGTYPLPFGSLTIDFDASELERGGRRLGRFIPVADLEVYGLPTRYRWPGLGAPLAASADPLVPGQELNDFVEPWAKVMVTALVRIERPRAQLADGHVRATLDLLTPREGETVTVDGHEVPLELETTAALAYTLAESPVWQQEIAGFLRGFGVIDEKAQLAALAPHRPGRIPLVFVHGTASSSGRWAEMLNELMNDSHLREHYAAWFFTYNTGNPILYSAMQLREALTAAVQRFDPDGTDPAMHEMILIGHSQGGLLAKLAVVDSGNAFWDNVSRTSIDEANVSEGTRDLLRRAMFVHPLPFVKRVIFVATPQHGSYFAGNFLSHWAARFITLPVDVLHAGTDFVARNEKAMTMAYTGRMATAVDNMTPGTRFIKTLAALPIAPDVAAHSIIAVDGDGPVEDGSDGIVAYKSAHIEGVESELVVRSSHSCQANPHTIEEVRRILFKHMEPQ